MAIVSFEHMMALPRLRQANRQRSYARFLSERWQKHVVWRLLPALSQVPLLISNPHHAPTSLAEVLKNPARIQLAAGLGFGKSLAIQQLIQRWIQQQDRLAAKFPVILHVPSIDLPPDQALAHELSTAGFSDQSIEIERGLAAGRWLLILDDWEHAAPAVRQTWKHWLEELIERYPALSIIVTTNENEPVWHECTRWQMAPITPEILDAWIQALLPNEESSVLIAPLLNDEHSRLVAERYADIAILALIYPSSGYPANRGRLYTTALDRVLRMNDANADLPRIKHALGQLASNWLQGRPTPIVDWMVPHIAGLNGLVTIRQNQAVFTSTLFALFCQALASISQNDWQIAKTHPQYWADFAPIAAGLMNDPAELYAVIRGANRPTPEATLLLGECLRQHHVPLPVWSSAILGALAQLGRQREYTSRVHALLANMSNVLNSTIAEQSQRNLEGERWCIALLRLLPPHLAIPHMVEMLADSRLNLHTRLTIHKHLNHYETAALLPHVQKIAKRALDDWGRLLVHHILAVSGEFGRKLVQQGLHKRTFLFPLHPTKQQAPLIVAIATALLADNQLELSTHTLAALALRGCANEQTAPILLQACIAGIAPLRAAARQALLNSNPGLAVRSLGRLVLGDDVHWAARYEALKALFAINSVAADALLVRVVASNIPLAARIEAARVVVKRNNESLERLIHLIDNRELSPSLRAALVSVIEPCPDENKPSTTLTKLLDLCCNPEPSPLRARAIRSMGHCQTDEVLAIIAGVVEHNRDDLESLAEAIQALGHLGDESSIWALRSVLLSDLASQFRKAWVAALTPEELESEPSTWNAKHWNDALQWRWGLALGHASTTADPPTSLDELVAREVQWIRNLAAQALGAIGGNSVQAVLSEALNQAHSESGFSSSDVIAQTLAGLDGGRFDLATSLANSQPSMNQWMQAQALERHVGGLNSFQSMVANNNVTTQTRSAMLVALGTDPNIVPMLETMITDDNAPLQLRLDAIRSISSINVSHLEGLLLALLSNGRTDPNLQIAALDTMHAPASEASIQVVRNILREPRPPVDVAAAALRCLVRLNNKDSISLFLRYAQSESPTLAIPAIDGLMLQSDMTTSALLTRLAHANTKSTRIRLHAIATLVKLEGVVHVPLVRQIMASGSIGIRLMALDILLSIVEPAELQEYLQPTVPLALRVRVAQALADHRSSTDLEVLIGLLESEQTSMLLRGVALEGLCSARYTPVLPYVEQIACDSSAPLALQRRAIEGLRHWRNEPTTLLTLSSLAESDWAFIRSSALSALLD